VKRLGVRRETLAAAAVVLALLAAGGALAFAVTAGAAPQGALQETTVPSPTDTGPTPDPAPAPQPAPKPAPKTTTQPKSAPTPHRTYTAPRTYSAPTRTYSTPAYTPPRATATHASKPRKHKAALKKTRPAKKPAVTTSTPAETTPVPAALVPVGVTRARSSPNGDHAMTSVLFIAGVTFAALLFLLAAAVPGTPARFTPVGRVVFAHQQDLVLVGVAAFVITVFVDVLTGDGL